MEKTDVAHLAHLARIAMPEDELEQFATEIEAILQYVGVVSDVAATTDTEPVVGPVHNVFRDDVVTNEPGGYTDTLLAAMPETDGRYMKVPKILSNDA